MARILVTRPRPAAERTAQRLRALGHAPIVSPLLTIRPLTHTVPAGHYDAVLMTSANAARHVEPDNTLRCTPCLVVGGATATAATAVGFVDVRSADGDVAALADLVSREVSRTSGTLLYIAGRERRGNFEALSRALSCDIVVVEVYAADPGALSTRTGLALAEGGIDAALLYSPRTAEAFGNVLRHADFPPPPSILCLSQAVATALPTDWAAPDTKGPAPEILWPDTPDESALLSLLPPP